MSVKSSLKLVTSDTFVSEKNIVCVYVCVCKVIHIHKYNPSVILEGYTIILPKFSHIGVYSEIQWQIYELTGIRFLRS
jgi:hypothetical protein